MARYLETAKRYNNLPVEILELIPEEKHEQAKPLIARLINAGFLGNPRAANGTIRLNYVNAMCSKIDVKCGLEERESENGRTYKALTVNGE